MSITCHSITMKDAVVPAITVCNQSLPNTPGVAPTTSPLVGTNRIARDLTRTNDGTTLTAVEAYYFALLENGYSFSVTLPDVTAMRGKTVVFVSTHSVYEAWLTLYGPINLDATYYTLSALSAVTFLSDGTRWWVISSSED